MPTRTEQVQGANVVCAAFLSSAFMLHMFWNFQNTPGVAKEAPLGYERITVTGNVCQNLLLSC